MNLARVDESSDRWRMYRWGQVCELDCSALSLCKFIYGLTRKYSKPGGRYVEFDVTLLLKPIFLFKNNFKNGLI